ncbi:hypothetical protein CEXT_165841 [Caerostris extrusa]|uniref:Uncharacterized protein n=1 Tax=Caerostris extrusa TaxID=172846 RepID=A0AAV4MDQ6_CAEEX|nr:hypothetical protein CEXT_165841 [Caerostris extrusa]
MDRTGLFSLVLFFRRRGRFDFLPFDYFWEIIHFNHADMQAPSPNSPNAGPNMPACEGDALLNGSTDLGILPLPWVIYDMQANISVPEISHSVAESY